MLSTDKNSKLVNLLLLTSTFIDFTRFDSPLPSPFYPSLTLPKWGGNLKLFDFQLGVRILRYPFIG
jgi:hypothetical protein